jgi:transposase
MTCEAKIKDIKTIFGISRASFFRKLKTHKGTTTTKRVSGSKCSKKVQNTRECKCNKNIYNYIKRYVCRFKIICRYKLISSIKNIFNVTISRSYYYKLLEKVGLTNKKLYIKKQPYPNEDYEEMKEIFYNKINDIGKDAIISIDETAIYLNCKSRRGWALKGCKCIIKEKNRAIYQKTYSLLMAISNKEVMLYITYEKSINGDRYLCFIKDLVNRYGNEYTLLMDNASIHKTKIFKEYAKNNNLNILYNIPTIPKQIPLR